MKRTSRCRRCNVILSRLKTRTKNFCSETSLHGFRFIAHPKSSKFKSYFWGLVCTISTSLCVILIFSQFRSYYSNRITTTILTTAFPIWEVPFPAVTICNFNLVYKARTKYFKELLGQYATNEEISNYFTNLSALILSNKLDTDIEWEDHGRVSRYLQRSGYTTDRLMAMVAHPCSKMITECYWNNKEKNCSEIFFLIKTNAGYCCSFNYKAIRNPFTNDEKLYVSGIGPSYGLSVHLNTEENQYISPLKHSLGIDVSVHETIQYPDMSIYTTSIRPGNDVSLSVKPEITQSKDEVKDTEISTRGCAFADEIKMAWSKSYSYTTCINECKAKVIKELCNCVPFYYYPVKGKTRYCSLPDMACIRRNNARFKSSKMAYNYFWGTSKKAAVDDNIKCKCYPPCNEITYSYQQDHQPLRSESETATNDSILRVYFGHVSCTKLMRSVLITWELILASVGGLIGLCLGGSIMSVIEFFYFLVETLFSRYGKVQKKEDTKLMKKYEPKIYLTDFNHDLNKIHKEKIITKSNLIFEVKNGKSKINK